MRIIDISKGIFSTPVYPGDPEAEISRIQDLDKGDPFNLSLLKASLHTGTHIDSPKHFIKDGKTIDQLPLELFIGKALVKDPSKLKNLPKSSGAKILLLKGNLELDIPLAKLILDKGFVTVGTELETIGNFMVHQYLLERNIGIIENINLESVVEGEYFLVAPPIKIEGAEASFTRGVLLEYTDL